MQFFSIIAAVFAVANVANALTSSLQQVTGFNAGPTKAGMFVSQLHNFWFLLACLHHELSVLILKKNVLNEFYSPQKQFSAKKKNQYPKQAITNFGVEIYVPTTVKKPAAIIVAIHYCQGTAQAYYSGSLYAQYADTYGYIVVYPNSPSSGGCWDVASTASLTHNGGGDSQTIVNMVSYAVANYGGDASRVYVTGSSSGAMMTNVLAAAYPEVFQAASAYSGVAAGCFFVAGSTANMATPGWSNQCANGQLIQTAQVWGNLARSYYPGYTGARPKMML